MKTIRLGVIGAGGRGKIAFNAHQPQKGYELIAACDTSQEALDLYTEKFGENILLTKDYRQLLQKPEVDAVFITTPDFLHKEHAVAALKAGKTVFLEKPLAITIEDCDDILQTAYQTKSKLYVGHNMRHFPAILKMKEIIDAGTIGDVQAVWCRHFVANGGDWYFKDWHSQRQNTTGLLLQKGAHDIDVIHWLAGDYTQRVTAMGRLSVYDKCARRDSATPGIAKSNVDFWPPLTNQGFSPQIDIEDHTMLLMQLANGVQASYLQCHYSPISTRNYVFIGTKGCVENIGTTGSCRVIVYTSRRQEGDFEPDITYQLRPLSGTHGGADPAIVNEFLEFVRSGGPTKTNPVGARMAVAAGVQGTRSVRQNNGAYDIPPLDEKLAAYFTNGQKEQ